MAGLPKHFSLISAQLGPDHDDQAHQALVSDLQGLKMKVTETDGKYGYPEKSLMVEHQGRSEDKSAVDALGRKYQQKSVLHSSFKGTKGKKGAHHNELRYMDGSPSVTGKGYRVDPSVDDNYTEHPSIGKFQMHLDFDSPEPNDATSMDQADSVKKSAKKAPKIKLAKRDIVKAFSPEESETSNVAKSSEDSKDDSEADKQAKIREKLEALRAKVKEEVIPAKDLAEGLENPEEECPACESQSEECSCYEGLSRPRLEFDGKKVTIFFKSDWGAEDKDNFKEDLKRRAGIILRKREEARSNALVKARKLIDTMRKGKK